MKKLISILCILTSLSAFAEDNVALKKGDVAAFDGILMPLDRAQRVNLMQIDLSTCTKVSGLKDDENKILNDRINNLNAENTNLSQRLVSSKEAGMWDKVGFFIIGAALTTVVAYGAVRATR
jgi:hypothetical protein